EDGIGSHLVTGVQTCALPIFARIGPGDFFGEMSLFDRSPRSATVQADSDATLLALDREGLRRMTEVSPRAAAAFFHALVLIFIRSEERRLGKEWGSGAAGWRV